MGGMEEELAQQLEESLTELPDLAQALRVAADTIEGVVEASIAAEDWEAAVLDRNLGRRKFRRLAADEIAAARS